jgi:thiosulfate dehydrogenase [quinone] large subunit
MNANEKTPLWPIAASRILIGILWLYSLRWKLPPDFAPAAGRGLLDWLQLEVQHPAFDLYGNFVANVVIPNFTVFAWIIFSAELLVGLSLLTGTLTRLGAAVGLLMAVNLGIGLLEVPGEWPWSYVMLAMWHGTFLVAGAGRLWGIDRWLRARVNPLPLLAWLT